MTDRILDFSERPVRLSIRDGLLRVRDEEETTTIPLDDVAVVVASHPQVLYTQAVLASLAGAGCAFIACDRQQMPVGMLLPLADHSTQAERFAKQVAASEPLRKRLWQQIVRSKIAAQARTLNRLGRPDPGLAPLAAKVRSGDPENVEARAARRYWPRLFADPDFRRRREGADQNRLLNYGYGVLRAMTARAICGSGLHPTFGLHHHNRYNAFALADDLMEMFRPLVDIAVARRVAQTEPEVEMNGETKAALIDGLFVRVPVEGEWRTVFDALAACTASLAAAFAGERKTLTLPRWDCEEDWR